jgi:predicted PurR-regulated permease PerM
VLDPPRTHAALKGTAETLRSLFPLFEDGVRDAGRVPEPQPPVDSRLSSFWSAADARGIPLRTILAAAAVVVLTYLAAQLVYRIRDILLIVLVAGFIALVLNPLVVALERWHFKRGQAVAAVTLVAVIAFIALAVAFGYPLVNGLTHLADRLPTYIRQAEHGKGWVGQLVRKYHVEAWVNKNAPKLTTFAKGLAKPALQLGKGALTLLLTVFTIFALVVLLLLEGAKLRVGLLALISPARATRYRRVASEVNRSVIGYVLGDLLTSVIAGVVVFVTLVALGVPFPLLFALWVALVDFIPVVGGALAGIPTVLFALGHSVSAGIVTLVVFLLYTQVENHVLNPVVMSKTVRVNPLLVLLSILIGASIGSWIGSSFGAFVFAVVAIPIAGAIQVVVRELWQSTGPSEAHPKPGATSVPSAPGLQSP